ncbi:hypothetical protein [Streptomyces sp. NPDC059709]|uniref:hypothetical protein n=1 Tax=Streptomyces sp. NPDC059709 TaxID=3346917 RepID=UPI0036813E25
MRAGRRGPGERLPQPVRQHLPSGHPVLGLSVRRAVPHTNRCRGTGRRRADAPLLTRLAIDWRDEYDLPLGIDTATWRAAAISPEENLCWHNEQIAAETDEERLKNPEGRAYCAAGHPVDAREGALRSYDAVRAQLPALIELLDDQDPEIRTRTAYLFGWFPEEADATLLPLLACLDGERDPIQNLGKLRHVVEQTFSLLHHFKRLAVRWERRLDLHDALVSLACSLICWRHLKKTHS